MFDATDLEISRRETAYELGGESNTDRAWSRFYRQATAEIIARGWDDKFTGGPRVGQSCGLDGCDDENGYSIDGAYDAWEARQSVATYVVACEVRRARLGL